MRQFFIIAFLAVLVCCVKPDYSEAEITYSDKSLGDQFTSNNANEIKNVVNEIDGRVGTIEGWGDHSLYGYLLQSVADGLYLPLSTTLFTQVDADLLYQPIGSAGTESDPVFVDWRDNTYSAGAFDLGTLEAEVLVAPMGLWDFTTTDALGAKFGPMWIGDDSHTFYAIPNAAALSANRSIIIPDVDTRIPAASQTNTDGTIIFPASGSDLTGTATLATASIATNTCATVVTVVKVGVVTTDVVNWGFATDVSGVTGYNPAGNLLYILAYPTAGNVNFKVCNKSGSAIVPGSAVVLNFAVSR